MKEKAYAVRVSCMTYNHAAYIVDAMNGFVMQQTRFPFVCTIVDDASTDGEQDVIKKYVSENFNTLDDAIAYDKDAEYGHVTFARHKTNKNCFFAIIYLKENHYSQKKSKAPYLTEWMDTKYIALCEGDDYWTDPMKLQKQVEYMEEHEECCMCAHAAYWECDGELSKEGCQYEEERYLSTDEVIRNGGLYLATCSLVYKKELADDWPEWRKLSIVGDFPIQILGTLRGKLRFFPETMSVYRFMRDDSWTKTQFISGNSKSIRSVNYAKNKILWMGLLDQDTGWKYTSVIYSYLFPSYNLLFNSNQICFFDYFRAAMKADEKHGMRVFKDFIILCFKPLYAVFGKVFKKVK